jgi:hypothetical protein
MIAVQFNDEVSLGNVVTLLTCFAAIMGAFFALRERSKSNGDMIEALQRRMDRVDIEQMKERTNTMWILQLRRGLVEAETRGLAVQESPVTLTDEALRYLEPLIPKLRSFYVECQGHSLSLIELADKLEIHMGHEITETVCRRVINTGGVPVSDAACLVLAIAVLRPISTDIIAIEAEETAKETIRNRELRDLEPKKAVKGGGLFGWLKH